jgi:hypothetical protein
VDLDFCMMSYRFDALTVFMLTCLVGRIFFSGNRRGIPLLYFY